MKRFNVHDIYMLGKKLFPVLQFPDKECTYKEVLFPLFTARSGLLPYMEGDTAFLSASKRAAAAVIKEITAIVPTELEKAVEINFTTKVYSFQISSIKSAISNLETVLSNDMPGICSYFVSQKGIYRTEDLITRAELHFHDDIRLLLPEKAKEDFNEAGKSLAFEIPTACAFHLWRAVETVMNSYYEVLHGKSFKAEGIGRNWDQYIRALNDAGADKKITQFLDHIRKEYRNPQTHPEETVTLENAFGLFGAAASSINQIMLEIKKHGEKPAAQAAA